MNFLSYIKSVKIFSLLSYKLIKNPALIIFLSISLGIVVSEKIISINTIVFFIVYLLTAILLIKTSKKLKTISVLFSLFLLLGFIIHKIKLNNIHLFYAKSKLEEKKFINIKGKGWICEEISSNQKIISSIFKITSLKIENKTIKCNHKVPIYIKNNYTLNANIKYGDFYEFEGTLHRLESKKIKGGFDPKNFYFRNLSSLSKLVIDRSENLILKPNRKGFYLKKLSIKLKQKFKSALLLGVNQENKKYSNIIFSILFGDKENIPNNLISNFKKSGSLHLFAISGLHVGIVSGVILFIFSITRSNRKISYILSIIIIFYYCILTGLSPSVMRASIMISVLLLSFVFKQQTRPLNSIGIAGTIILLINSQELFTIGFQLSFIILIFLCTFGSSFQKLLLSCLETDKFIPHKFLSINNKIINKIALYLSYSLSISILSWLATLYILIYYFNGFSTISILSNILMVPVTVIIVNLGSFSILSYILNLSFISLIINKINVFFAFILTFLAQLFSNIPYSYINVKNNLIFENKSHDPNNSLTLNILGSYGKSANLLSFPKHNKKEINWLIDCGNKDLFKYKLLPFLQYQGINKLDALIISHLDKNHIGSIVESVKKFNPKLLIQSSLTGKNNSRLLPKLNEVNSLIEKTINVNSSYKSILKNNVKINFLWPDSDNYSRTEDDRSLVIKITYNHTSILMSFDIGFETEKKLLKDNSVNLKSKIWIRGNHQSKIAPTTSFIKAISPEIIISSIGSENITFQESTPEKIKKEFLMRDHNFIQLIITNENTSINSMEGKTLYRISNKLKKN